MRNYILLFKVLENLFDSNPEPGEKTMSQARVQQLKWGGAAFPVKVKRKGRRKKVFGFVGDIADTASLVGGEIENICAGGFKMINISDTFTAANHTYTVVLNEHGNYYRLVAKPCWKKKGVKKGSIEIGFKIIDAPWEWVDLTLDGTH